MISALEPDALKCSLVSSPSSSGSEYSLENPSRGHELRRSGGRRWQRRSRCYPASGGNFEPISQLKTFQVEQLVRSVSHVQHLHLAFDCGILRSTGFSHFKRIELDVYPNAETSQAPETVPSRQRTAAILIIRHVCKEPTYITWAAKMYLDVPCNKTKPRNVLVKIAIDEEGEDDLRDEARHYQCLAERGLSLGFYGIFKDEIGSIALLIDDLGGETVE